ncbi:helix-turn-helix domain-containing protein [Nocardia sp. SYP-A9097]|uniref:helix-turn-helix domain-containing protein n=1 Tax=Nocardia sp. SYP-A9097 TaxID=2663237 RepID=UPI001891857C|nr:helix-turn-helix transcriptional regulator [Nocardia sp. SYP-A9097]
MDDESGGAIWEFAPFRQLLAAGRIGPALALVRKAMGLSQADFGELLHWDRAHTGRVERGDVATVFDVRELRRIADALGIPRLALLPLLLEPDDARSIETGGREGADNVDRRQFGLTAALASTGTAAWTTPIQVKPAHLAYVRTLNEQLWVHDNLHGGGGIARRAHRQYRFVRRLVENGTYSLSVGLELTSAVGWLSNTVAWLARDCGRPQFARQQLMESVLLAEQSRDFILLAATVGDLANLAAAVSTTNLEPVRLAQRSTELVRSVSSVRLNALKAAEESTAYAAVGDLREFERALTRVDRECDRGLDSGDDPAWLNHVTEAELRVHEARGRKLLGQHSQAANLFRESINRPATLPRDEASYRTYYAASLTGLGDTTTAITAAHTALDLLESQVNSPRLLCELRPIRRVAARIRTAEAEHFAQRFDALTQAA